MEGLGSSGRLVGTISTDPGTYTCPWSGVMAKNPGGELFRSSPVYENWGKSRNICIYIYMNRKIYEGIRKGNIEKHKKIDDKYSYYSLFWLLAIRLLTKRGQKRNSYEETV